MKADDTVFPHNAVPLDDIGLMFIPANTGITARDHIAIEAMNGLLAADVDNIHTHQNIAEMAYEQADVMIAESEK